MATERAVIELVADPSGLKAGYDALNALGQLSVEQQEAFKKANSDYVSYQQRAATEVTKVSTAQAQATVIVKETTKAVQDLTAATDNLNKSKKVEIEIGNAKGTYVAGTKAEIEALKQKQAATEAATAAENKAIGTYINLQSQQIRQIEANKKVAETAKQVQTEIAGNAFKKAASDVNEFTAKVVDASQANVSLRTQIRNNVQELAELRLAGQQNTQQYKDLEMQTAKLDAALVSTRKRMQELAGGTQTVDGLVGVMRGAVGVFTIAKGAAALFAGENKELEKTLTKLIAAMAVLNGLQEISNALKTGSAARQLIENGQKSLLVLITKLDTAATSENTAVKWLAIEAQIALNAAMDANPVMLLIGAIVAISAALFIFSDRTDKAAEKQLIINKAIKDGIDLNNEAAQAVDRHSSAVVTALEKEIALARNSMQGREQIEKLEDGIYKARLEAANQNAKDAEIDILFLNERIQQLDKINVRMRAYTSYVAEWGHEFSKAATKEYEADKANAEALKAQIKYAQDARDAKVKAETDYLDFQNTIIKNSFQTAIDRNKATIVEAGKITKAKEQAEIASLETLMYQTERTEALTAEQTLLLEAETADKIAALHAKYRQLRIEDERKAIDAQLQHAVMGSQRQLVLRLQDLHEEQLKELAEYGLTENEKNDIVQRHEKQRNDMLVQFQMSARLQQLAADKALIDARLAGDRNYSEQSYISKLHLAQIESDMVLAKAKSDLEQLKITQQQYDTLDLENHAAFLTKKSALDKEYIDKQFANMKSESDADFAHQKAQNDLVKTSLKIDSLARYEAALKDFDITRNRINEEIAQEEGKAASLKGIDDKAAAEALQRAQVLRDQSEANDVAQENMKIETNQKLVDMGFSIAKQGIDAALNYEVEAARQAADARLKILENAMNAELNMENISNVQKAAIRNKYRKEEAAQKLKAWKADQNAKLESAFINMALGITQSLANTTLPFPASLIGPVTIAAAAGVQIAAIEAAKPPAFATGVINFQGKGTGTSDSNPVLISHGESVVTAAATDKYSYILDAMNKGMELPQFSAPTVSSEIMNTFITTAPEFDYDRFGNIMAEKLKANPQFHLTLDQSGYNVHVQQGIHRKQLLNNRVSSK